MKRVLVFFTILSLFFGPFWKVGVRGEEEPSTFPPEVTPSLTPETMPTGEVSPELEPTPTKEISLTPTPEPSFTPTPEISPTPAPALESVLTPTPEIGLLPPPEILPSSEPEPELLSAISDQIEGEGTEFKLEKEGNVSIIKTSTPIRGLFELTAGGMILNFEAADESQAAIFTISGFLPNYTYHLYTDDFHNHREVISDSEGNLVFTQDISSHRLLIIQPLPSTKYIRNDATGGNCTSIGIWNNTTKTCTLTTDVAETIQIDASGITLDGNNRKVNPPVGTTYGVYFKSGVSGSKVKNIKIYNASYGIGLYQANNNTVENVFTSNNSNYGIYLSYSSGNTVSGGTFERAISGVQLYYSGNNTFINNTFTKNTSPGIHIYIGSHGNTFSQNKIVNNFQGILFDQSDNNIFIGNIIAQNSSSEYGLYFRSKSKNNQFKENIFYKNGQYGIKFQSSDTSSGNLFEHNLISNHDLYGIYAPSQGADIYKSNVLLNNKDGIVITSASNNNVIEGNLIKGSYFGLAVYSNNNISKNVFFGNSYGLYLQNNSSNTITNNIFKNSSGAGMGLNANNSNNIIKFNYFDNNRYGLYIYDGYPRNNNNQIYNNNFVYNQAQVVVTSSNTGNVFNLAAPTGGNYWGNWTTPDNNNDGFVDKPYTFSNGVDNLPWTKVNGWLGFLTTDNLLPDWRKNNINVILTCKDKNNNNCDQTFYRINNGGWQTGTNFLVEEEGFHLIEYYSVHQGISEETKFTYALLDKTPPTLSGAPTKPPYWNNWYNAPVIVKFVANDYLSGLQNTPADVVISSDGENQSAQGTATDQAGNSTTVTVGNINIDLTPPTTTVNFSGEHGSGNWYKSDVVVSLTATDSGSGVKRIEYSFDGINWQEYTSPFALSQEGLNKFYYRAIDNVDNIERVSKTETAILSNDLKNYNSADWNDATYLPGFVGRPQNLSTCGIKFGDQPWYYGYCLYGYEDPPNANKRRAISYAQSFNLASDTRIDFAALPRDGTPSTTPLEMIIYDINSNNFVRIAAREISYYNRTIQTEIGGFGVRESGHLWTDGVWLLFRLESKDGKVKISVLDTDESVLWSTIYNVNLKDLISTYKISFGNFAESGQPYRLNYYPIADDIKIINTNWVFKSGEVNIDKVPPSVNASFSGTKGANDWYIDEVTATLEASDNNGIDKIGYSYDNVNWNNYSAPLVLSSSGEFTFYYRAYDLAGNSTAGSQNIKIDRNPPVTSFSIEGEEGNNNWYRSDVAVAFSAVDKEGGMSEGKTEYSFDGIDWEDYSNPVNIAAEGITLLRYYSIDSAGNREETKEITIKIDKTPPIITGTRTPSPNDYNWNNENVTVSFTCTDESSGIESCTPETLVSNEGIAQYVEGVAEDKAGNTAIVTVSGINIDKTKPEIKNIVFPSPNVNGWYNLDVSISYSCFDSLSGPLIASDFRQITTEGANQSAVLECADLAGNSETEEKNGINIDKTKPEIIIRSPANQSYLLNQLVLADWEVSDNLSGLENSSATIDNGETIDTTAVGSHIFEVTAVDYAGNSNSTSVIYNVDYVFGGILSPINSDGSSIFKLGRTIPVKFKLYDYNQSEVSNATAFLNIAKISNNVLGTEMEAVSTSQATEGNLFRYDPIDKQYIFNLNTKNMSVGTWALIIYLNDGSTRNVTVSLK